MTCVTAVLGMWYCHAKVYSRHPAAEVTPVFVSSNAELSQGCEAGIFSGDGHVGEYGSDAGMGRTSQDTPSRMPQGMGLSPAGSCMAEE